jgi:hypothetical protein
MGVSEPGRSMDAFQSAIDQVLIRHRSVLDILTKLPEANAGVLRVTAQAVTVCGCIQVDAGRQRIPADADVETVHRYVQTHIQGSLCDRCKEALADELGQSLFYHAALAEVLDLSLADILDKELTRLKTLGIFNLL